MIDCLAVVNEIPEDVKITNPNAIKNAANIFFAFMLFNS